MFAVNGMYAMFMFVYVFSVYVFMFVNVNIGTIHWALRNKFC